MHDILYGTLKSNWPNPLERYLDLYVFAEKTEILNGKIPADSFFGYVFQVEYPFTKYPFV